MEPAEVEKLSETERGQPRRAEPSAELERGAARGAKPPLGSTSGAASAAAAARSDASRRYPPDAKRELVEAYATASAAGETMQGFCARHRVSTASLCKWRKGVREQGEAGLGPRPNPRNAHGPHRGAASYTPEQCRQAVEGFLAAGQTLKDFARLWGVSANSLASWVNRHREEGPKALEPMPRGRPRDATVAGHTTAGAAQQSSRNPRATY